MEEKQYEDIEQEFWKPIEIDDEVSGIYMGMQEEVGENKGNVYNLKTSNGNIIGVWESTVIKQKMNFVNIGDDIRIFYLGKVKPEKGKEYKNFKVQKAKTN